MQFIPYINFDGNCAEAFAFYAKLFGGTVVRQATFGEMPPNAEMPALPEPIRNRIMHVHLQIKDQALMGSDALPAAPGQDPAQCGGGYQQPQGLWVSIQAADAAEGQRLFDALSPGGQTVMPFAATFWSPGFGMVRDRFGTPWMLNVAAQA
ncbi:MAG: VOC family protein [Proteobacteria bacterium]|nr:VOC family protein [Pseudomonadota bacterium]